MKKLKHGILIALEGIDGSGKSTLARNLHDALSNQELPILLTKEPGATPLGQQLRTILQTQTIAVGSLAEYLLFAADRAQHFHELVIPALQSKKLVLSDRMADSSLVYQGYGRGLDKQMIQSVNTWAMHNKQPDLTLYVRVDLATAQKRLIARKKELTAFEKERTNFMQRLVDGFEKLYKNRDDVIILDGTQTPESVAKQAMEAVNQWLAEKRLA